jgi:hypothetical protein
MDLLGDIGHVESWFSHLVIVLVLVKHRCMVCAKHTISSKVILDAPDGTLR